MFSKVFPSKPKEVQTERLQLLNDYKNYFTPQAQNWDDMSVRACIDTIARNAAKFKPTHIRRIDGKPQRINGRINDILKKPNPLMTIYDFLYKIVANLYTDNNAFVYLQYDAAGNLSAMYPIAYRQIEMREATNGEIFCKFDFQNNHITVPYTDIVHIRRKYNKNEVYGESDSEVLANPLSILTAARQSIQNAVENSTRMRGYIKAQGVIREDDLQNILQKFLKKIDSGIGILDAKSDYHALTSDIKMADSEQLSFAQNEIYSFFGVSPAIISGDFSEQQYNAFFENVLEPLAIQMGQAFTQALFTSKEKSYNNEIIFTTNRLEYSSLENKTKMMQVLQQSSILTINEAREIFGFEPIYGGEKLIVKADYTPQDINTEEDEKDEQK